MLVVILRIRNVINDRYLRSQQRRGDRYILNVKQQRSLEQRVSPGKPPNSRPVSSVVADAAHLVT